MPTIDMTKKAGPSRGVGESEVEPASVAARRKGEEAVEQGALAAARAAASRPAAIGEGASWGMRVSNADRGPGRARTFRGTPGPAARMTLPAKRRAAEAALHMVIGSRARQWAPAPDPP